MGNVKAFFKQLFPQVKYLEGVYTIVFFIDFLDAVKLIPDQYFEMIITDPPYNVNFTGKKFNGKSIKHNKTLIPLKNDNLPPEQFWEFNHRWFQAALRISKGLIFTCGIQNLYEWIKRYTPPYLLKGWYKPAADNFQDFDPILAYGNIANIFPNYILKVNIKTVPHCNHECPKPLELYQQIVKRLKYPNPICDPFLGSGTLLEVAEQFGIEAVGFEIDYDQLSSTIDFRIKNGISNFGKQATLESFI